MNTRWPGAFIIVLLAAHPANADWVFGAFAGGAHTNDTSLTLRQPAAGTDVTFARVRFESDSLTPPIYYGYRGGWFPKSRWLGIEGELIHLKATADTSLVTDARGTIRGQSVAGPRSVGEVLDRFSITHGVNLLLVNAVMRKWGLVGRLGVGGSIPHAESAAAGVSLERYQWGALSLQGSAGAEIRIAGSLYASGEYKLTRTAQNVTIVSGSARTSLVTHHLVLGVAWRLGDRRKNP
jgi:hypothetical protein